MATGPIIHLRNAVALLNGFPALAGADLDVDSGEVVLLQGPNGAGKSTLLRALAGLVPLEADEAWVLGSDLLRDRRSVRLRVGLLGHASGLYDDLTVRDNVMFAVRAARKSVAAVDPTLERLGLAGRLASVGVGRLSAGQRRRVSLAVLVARAAELWLLDEPHAGLDAEGRDLLDAVIREAAGTGRTVVMASHELDRAGALASRVLTVAGGLVRPNRSSQSTVTARPLGVVHVA